MVTDLHSHLPMYLFEQWAQGEDDVHPVRTVARARTLRRPDKFRALLIRTLSRKLNRRTEMSGPRVTFEQIERGSFRVVFSVIYSPIAEIDLSRGFVSDPLDDYFGHVMHQIGLVEGSAGDGVAIVRDKAQYTAARKAGKPAIVHCIEGGMHLGASDAAIRRNVAALADKGIVYITIAHLFWRGYAENVNAIPFIPNRMYDVLFKAPEKGLTDRGEVAVRAMAQHGILVDISHMHPRALADTWELLDEVAPTMPVIASHAGFRFHGNPYMLDTDSIGRIASRGGVIGLIMGQHLLGETKTAEDTPPLLFRHINRIRDITGSYDHIGIGSDLAGFIKPTVTAVENADDLADLLPALRREYGTQVANKIAYGNAERVLKELWAWKATPEERRVVRSPAAV